MVVHLHLRSFLSLHSSPSSNLLCPIPIPFNFTTAKSGCRYGLDNGGYSVWRRRRRRRNFQVSRASDRDEFEIDQEKAIEALRLFDEEIRSYKQKQTPSPKIRATSLNTERDEITTDPADDLLSGPFLGTLTFALLLFTIFYNIFYFTVLEPTSFGRPPDSTTREASERIPLMEF